MRIRRLVVVAVSAAVVAATVVPATASLESVGSRNERRVLMEYAADTWHSFEAMVDPGTGIPADNVEGDLDPATRSAYTSPTNIGGDLLGTPLGRGPGS